MTLLAIDPGRSYKGEKSIGASVWWMSVGGRQPEEVERCSLSFEELQHSLIVRSDFSLSWRGDPIHEVVIEDYVNNTRAKGGQRNGTSECIGMVEDRCYLTETPFTRQEPAALYAAKLHAPKGSFKELKHLRHEDSAFLHGFEFLVRRGDIEVDLSATM